MNNSIIFIGDSLTEWGNWKELFPDINIRNYGIAGNKTYEVLQRLDLIKEANPKKIFLMIGINDLADNRNIDDVFNDFQSIVIKLQNQFQYSKLYTLSILPIVDNDISNTFFTNKYIIELNNKIESFSRDLMLIFIDMYSYFLNEKNQLKAELREDAVHLSKDGYTLWKNLISNYLQ